MHTLVLKVSGMHCGACASRVERALRGVPGVVQAAVEVATATATVTLDDPPAALGALEQAVAQAGYEAHAAAPGRARTTATTR